MESCYLAEEKGIKRCEGCWANLGCSHYIYPKQPVPS